MTSDPRVCNSPVYSDLVDLRLSRRAALLGLTSIAALAGIGGIARQANAAQGPSSLTFPELAKIYDETHHVAQGYKAETLVRWGDPIVAGAKAYDAKAITVESQAG